MNNNVKIKNKTWSSETLQKDGDWKIIVLEMTKDTKGKHTVFRLAAEPWPASFRRKSTHTGDDIIRRFSDCHWLDKSFRKKYPFLIIPTCPPEENLLKMKL